MTQNPKGSVWEDRDSHDPVCLLFELKRIRCVEETIADRYSEQKMRCPTHLSIGQEAAAVGVCSALQVDDQVLSSHRAHAHYLAKGGDLNAMIAELYGKSTGCSSGKGGSMHLVDLSVGFLGSTAIVANTIPVGVGVALANQIKKNDRICCIFFGDAAVEEGVFHEALNFAVLKMLPVLFVCENNFYSVYSPLKVRQPTQRSIWKFAAAYGANSEQGDGNNVLEVRELAIQAIKRIREGAGPCFLELITYRWREHCGPNYDNNLGYRSNAEFLTWKSRDPINRLEKWLLNKERISSADVLEMDADIQQSINRAFKFAEESSFPCSDEICSDIYSEV